MRLTPALRAYLRANYSRYKDAELAKALDVSAAEIRAAAKRLKLKRSREDIGRLRQGSDGVPPAYDGQRPRPTWLTPLTRRDGILATVTALAILAVYVATLPPSVTGEDSGELITAAYTLGIPHPPGYPLWCLVTHPFVYLPFGSVAWRVAFSSAVFGSAAVAVLVLITVKLTGNRFAAIVAAAATGLSQQFWMQNVIAEVYALNSLLFLGCLFFLIAWYEKRQTRYLYLLSALYGLSLTNHHTMFLVGPVFLVAFLLIDPEPWRRWGVYLKGAGIAAAMLLVYLYLPIRSAADPPVDWGNPENWENFRDVVTREQFSFALTENPRTIGRLADQIGVFLREYADQWTIWLAWIPAVGLWALWRRDRLLTIQFALLLVATSLGLIAITNFDTDPKSIWLNSVFWIPTYLVAGVFIACGLDWLTRRIPRPDLRGAALAAAGVGVILLPFLANQSRADKSDYYFAQDYGQNVLRTLEPDSLYIPSADHATFPVLYLQAVEGMRPDITIADKYGYIDPELFQDMPEPLRMAFRKIPTDAERRVIEKWLIERSDQPVFFTEKRPTDDLPEYGLDPAGMLYRLVRPGEEYAHPDVWETYAWHTLDEGKAAGELSASLILADYHFARGRAHLAEDNKPRALEAMEKSASLTPESAEALNNIATAFAEHGDLDTAAEFYLRALEVDADYVVGLRNLAHVYMMAEKFSPAAVVFERLVTIAPEDVASRFAYARCLRQLGRRDDAVAELTELAEAWPDDGRVQRDVGMVYINEFGDQLRGREHLMRSFNLDSSQMDLALMLGDPAAITSTAPGLPGLPQFQE